MKLVEEKGIITRKEYEKLDQDERLNYWQIDRNNFKLISELDNEHLQSAFCYAQNKELEFHNKVGIFCTLVQNIETEAEKRSIRLNDLQTEYHRKERAYKSKISAK